MMLYVSTTYLFNRAISKVMERSPSSSPSTAQMRFGVQILFNTATLLYSAKDARPLLAVERRVKMLCPLGNVRAI
ncbi:hypothetical protein EON63_01070 [archaeon]|nr:MAG: hypothetical protein EON63_01070 [archaeon]